MKNISYRGYIPIILFLLLLILSFFVVKPFLEALLIAALLAYIFYPVHKKVSNLIHNETLSSILITIFVFLLIVIPAIFLVKTAVEQSYTMIGMIGERLDSGILTDCRYSICDSLHRLSQNALIVSAVEDGIKSLTSKLIQQGSSILFSIPHILLNLFVMLFVFFYFLKEGEFFLKKIKDYLNVKKKDYRLIVSRLKEIIHGVVFGYILIALMQGALGALGFWIFGVPTPLFWGAIMAFLALVPYLGTGFIWAPAALFMLFDGLSQNSNTLVFKAIGLAVYSFVVVSSLDNLIRPKLISGKAKIHPTIIMLGIFGGLALFGVLGVIIGPLVLSVAFMIIEIYVGKEKKE